MDALRELQELLRQEGHPPLDNVTFYHGEASAVIKEKNLSFSHVYSFDYCINDSEYMGELAEAIENMPFKIFCSSKKKAYWELFEFYVKEIYFDGGFKNDVDFRMSKSKERHRMYFYEKQHLDLSTVHATVAVAVARRERLACRAVAGAAAMAAEAVTMAAVTVAVAVTAAAAGMAARAAAAGAGEAQHNYNVAKPRLVGGASPTWRKPRLV